MSRSPMSQTMMASSTSSNKWRSASKRQILGNTGVGGVGSSSSSSAMDGRNSDHVKLMIAGLKEKHDQMIAFLKSDLDDCKLEQEEVLSTGFMKLPKAVRTMSIKAFNSKHSCDLLSLLKSKDGVVLAGVAGPGAVASSKKNMNMNNDDNKDNNDNDNNNKDATKKRCFETPAPRMRRVGWGAAPGTVVRTARRGEGIYSQNGSPLAATEPGTVIATICKKRRGNDNNNESESESASANVEINVGEGQYISLNDPNGVSELDANMKQTAASQLKVLQDQMASLMAQLKR